MPRLVAKILLCIALIPLAALLYTIAFLMFDPDGSAGESASFTGAGAVTWTFLAISWFALWFKSVKWTRLRIWLTAACFAAAPLCGLAVAAGFDRATAGSESGINYLIATTLPPLLWLIGVTLVWRETIGERRLRLNALHRGAVVCPTCGYNLTGLSEPRCPECGSSFTLDQLVMGQRQTVGTDLVE